METFRAIFLGGLPVMVFTVAVVQWSVASGRMPRLRDGGDLAEQYTAHAKRVKGERKSGFDGLRSAFTDERARGDLLHSKIMSFGGGYYGTMAALTFLFIEATDVWSFLVGVFSPHTVMLEVIPSLLVQLVINSFMNLLGALLWFVTLPNQVDMNEGWIWLVASYLGYLAGLRLAAIAGDKIQAQVKKSFARLRKA